MADANPQFIAPEDPAAETSGDSHTSEPTPEPTPKPTETVDYKDRFEAQQKVNRDLERKYKEAITEKERADALQAKLDGKEAEYAVEQAKREAEQAYLAKANDKILRSEIKAAAKGVLADPADAYKFLDLDSFEVGDDGDVDDAAITAALKTLIEEKPYLAAQGQRFQGGADGGTRKESGTKQLTRADMARMTPEQIEKARTAGQFNDLLNGK